MTFKNLQDRVMARFNLTSTDARDRIKTFLNERYRRLQTSISLGKVRRSSMTFDTVNGTVEYSPTSVIKIFTISYPAGNRVLEERTLDELRNMDPDRGDTGDPKLYAVTKYGATSVTIELYPKPTAVYTLRVDGLMTGTDMSNDNDVPAFPEDFHDALEFAAAADEAEKAERMEQSERFEQRYRERVSDLRYFLSKSAYLHHTNEDNWWGGPWPGGYFGWGGW